VAFAGLTVNTLLLDVTLLIVSVVGPAFVTTTLSSLFCPSGTSPNGTVFRLRAKPGSIPVPLTATVSGELDALWMKMTFPVCAAVFAGVNVM
jgi:hypothetical protein